MNYSEYAKILKQLLCDKEIDEDALKIYNSSLYDKLKNEMHNKIIGYYSDTKKAINDNKKYFSQFIDSIKL